MLLQDESKATRQAMPTMAKLILQNKYLRIRLIIVANGHGPDIVQVNSVYIIILNQTGYKICHISSEFGLMDNSVLVVNKSLISPGIVAAVFYLELGMKIMQHIGFGSVRSWPSFVLLIIATLSNTEPSMNLKIIERIAKRLKVLFFLHPITEKKIYHYGFYNRLKENPRLELRPRYSYFQFIKLLYGSELMVTDGGSNQEESSYLGKPCLLLRKATERQEGLRKNVCLSQMMDSIINDFINGYSRFSKPFLQEKTTPSSIIVSEIERFQNNTN